MTSFRKMNFKCEKCPHLGGWNTQWRLNEHMRDVHPADANMLLCQFCKKNFKSVKSCRRHIQMCEQAKETFWKPRSLEGIPPFPSIASKNSK